MKMNRKAQSNPIFGVAVPLVLAFIVLVVTIAVSQQMTGNMKVTQGQLDCATRTDVFQRFNTTVFRCQNNSGTNFVDVGTVSFNATVSGNQGLDSMANQTPTLAIIGIALVLLMLIVGIFGLVRLGRR